MRNDIRRVLEDASHRFVFRRRLPRPFNDVRLYATTEGGLRYLRPSLRGVDPTLLHLVDRYVTSGASVWDVGANLGLFSLSAAWAVGPSGTVLAVEADAWMATLLRRSINLNNWSDRVELLSAASANSFGIGTFEIAKRSRATSHLEGFGSTQTGGTRERQVVPLVPLDALLVGRRPPDILKIDVEGAEAMVLEGAAHVLESQPLIILEVAEEASSRVQSILEPHRYEFFDGERLEAGRITSLAYTTVAVPRNRRAVSRGS